MNLRALTVLGIVLWAATSPAGAAARTSTATSAIPLQQWTLSGGTGQRISLPDGPGTHALRVTGDGADTNYWHCNVPFEPGGIYRFRFRYRRGVNAAGGVIIAGPAFANRDFLGSSIDWQTGSYVFAAPLRLPDGRLRLGQWHVSGNAEFTEPNLVPIQPAHRRVGAIELGAGEELDGKTYHFRAPLADEGSNYSRALGDFTARFNTSRWVFTDGRYVIYHHRLAGSRQRSARLEVNVNHYTRGRCVVEASKDGTSWTQLGAASQVGAIASELPEKLLPADELLVRIRAAEGGAFQVNGYQYSARLEGPKRSARGDTCYLEASTLNSDVQVRVDDLGLLRPGFENLARVSITNKGPRKRSLIVSTQTGPEPGPSDPATLKHSPSVEVAAGVTTQVSVPLVVSAIGGLAGRIDVRDESGELLFTGRWRFFVPVLYDVGYGQRLPTAGKDVTLWWCDATRKVSRDRVVPQRSSEALRMAAARNDFEAAQLVVRPKHTLAGLKISVSDLSDGEGGTIPASNIELLRVGYVRVRVPTDPTGVADNWPDPLPAIKGPLNVSAGLNQPIWILVHVPADAAAGDYEGRLSLVTDNWRASVPINLHVWDFTLPVEPYTHSAFGLSMSNVYRYHGLDTQADRRAVFEKYMQSFADHRISPYDPTPLDPIEIRFVSDADPPRAELNFEPFDAAMQRAVGQWHITSFRLNVPGMGGGSFHSRRQGQITGFPPDSPEYRAMFSSMVKQLKDHLDKKGWLDKAYVYWFDEPAPRDYDFVRVGMDRLGQYAPGIRRMLTEEPVEPLFGAVDLWCPVSFNYNHELAEKRRERGEQFWWYVCTGPKAPYCTLFIDHPATDLRVWLWQTWQRKIAGILVWQSTYWTSRTAFPDSLQDPYEDPMGYVSGYSTANGTKAHWGNGDGRFLYPPESAAGGSSQPVLEGPVSSIRWEMLREGIEDLDYLHILAEAIESDATAGESVLRRARSLLEVPAEITTSMTQYTFDSTPIYEQRRAVAEMIERLTASGG